MINDKTIIVAEFTTNHAGNINRLKTMIKLAAEAGADYIKLQKREVSSFYSKEELDSKYISPFGNTLREYRNGIELNFEDFKIVDKECKKYNIKWFASILDWPSYLFIKQFNMPLLKLPSTISNHKDYIKQIAENYKGDIVISTGFTNIEYEKFILNLFGGQKNHFYLLQCTSSYPAPIHTTQISVVRHYDKLHLKYANIFSGYSSHDIGSLGCQLAVAAGAKMIEKHVKLGNLEWLHFDDVAVDLENGDFKQFVQDIRKAEIMCGNEIKTIKKEENHKYK